MFFTRIIHIHKNNLLWICCFFLETSDISPKLRSSKLSFAYILQVYWETILTFCTLQQLCPSLNSIRICRQRTLWTHEIMRYFSLIVIRVGCKWELWCWKHVSHAWISNCIQQNTVGSNYLSMHEIPASGTKSSYIVKTLRQLATF